jgi:hypothetical protein
LAFVRKLVYMTFRVKRFQQASEFMSLRSNWNTPDVIRDGPGKPSAERPALAAWTGGIGGARAGELMAPPRPGRKSPI